MTKRILQFSLTIKPQFVEHIKAKVGEAPAHLAGRQNEDDIGWEALTFIMAGLDFSDAVTITLEDDK